MAKPLTYDGESPQDLVPSAASGDPEWLDETIELGSPSSHVSSELVDESEPLFLTQPGTTLGTPGYLAPEQLRGTHLDDRADLFSVGAVFYELLTAERAFPGRTVNDRLQALWDLASLELAHKLIPRRLRSILDRALQKRSDARFASARDMLAELRKASTKDVENALSQTLAITDLRNHSGQEAAWIGLRLREQLETHLSRFAGVDLLPSEQVAAARQRTILGDAALGAILGCKWLLPGENRLHESTIEFSAQLLAMRSVYARDPELTQRAIETGRLAICSDPHCEDAHLW